MRDLKTSSARTRAQRAMHAGAICRWHIAIARSKSRREKTLCVFSRNRILTPIKRRIISRSARPSGVCFFVNMRDLKTSSARTRAKRAMHAGAICRWHIAIASVDSPAAKNAVRFFAAHNHAPLSGISCFSVILVLRWSRHTNQIRQAAEFAFLLSVKMQSPLVHSLRLPRFV